MLDMLQYAFMQRAFLSGIVLGVAIPLVGVIVVLKRLSMIGDTLSHASLAGVAGGLIAGINPVAGATVACLAAACFVEMIRKRLESRGDLAIAIVMAAGDGLAGVRICAELVYVLEFSLWQYRHGRQLRACRRHGRRLRHYRLLPFVFA